MDPRFDSLDKMPSGSLPGGHSLHTGHLDTDQDLASDDPMVDNSSIGFALSHRIHEKWSPGSPIVKDPVEKNKTETSGPFSSLRPRLCEWAYLTLFFLHTLETAAALTHWVRTLGSRCCLE